MITKADNNSILILSIQDYDKLNNKYGSYQLIPKHYQKIIKTSETLI